jgi:acetyltransferase-like isoleucine patch superfamily enzyme
MLEFKGNKGKYYRFILKFLSIKDSSGIYLAKGSKIPQETVIDNGSRMNRKITIKGIGRCSIGKYVAFGDGIKIITSNHKKEEINLQYALSNRIGIQPKYDSKINVFIGHNVWIGDNVIILPGVTIGNGAIIGAGSVVTKDVLPFGIVVGVPARFVKFRFSAEKIKEIEESSWWDWSENKMRNNIDFFI